MVGTVALDQAEAMDTDLPDQEIHGHSESSRSLESPRTGNKNLAESCPPSTKSFSLDDPKSIKETYVLAKADGDIGEAAKCLSGIFDDLYPAHGSHSNLSSEASVVVNFMREEVRLMLNELKGHYLKLKSAPSTSTGSYIRQAPSVSQSPLLSPRLRMSSEDRSMGRDSMLRLDNHLKSSKKSLFYQQMFEHLSNDYRRRMLDHAIEDTENLFERCRLMMLTIALFSETVINYGPKLLKTLIDLSQQTSEKSATQGGTTIGVSRSSSMCQYARGMLALDAIPLILSSSESKSLDIDLDELFQRVVNYYSEQYLENVAQEYDFEELHEGLKKTIAARILEKNIDGSTQDELVEDNLNVSLNLLFERFLNDLSNDTIAFASLRKLRSLVSDKANRHGVPFNEIIGTISGLELENDIPENILFSCGRDESSSPQGSVATPPSKARGRPKKSQASVIVSPIDGVRKHLQSKAREALFVYTSLMQYMFNNCSKYLKQTRSRILMRFDNPLATQIETELTRAPAQRASRGRNAAQDASSISPPKKMKTKHVDTPTKVSIPETYKDGDEEDSFVEPSPLNSEQSIRMDREILETLKRANQCIEFMTSSATLNRLFQRFLKTNNSDSLRWFLKISADCMLSSDNFEKALGSLDRINKLNIDHVKVKEERLDPLKPSTLTFTTGSSAPVEVIHLRALVQSVSCNIQLLDRDATLSSISLLLERIRQSGLLNNDENYATGNIMDEYRILVPSDAHRKQGFLFFDGLSLIRYVVVVLTDILKRYIAHATPSSDSLIGHTIVLSQVDWPKEAPLYEKCISWIRVNKPTSTTPQCLSALTKFTYPDFFSYILDPNMLEDFMALLNDGFTLDIKSVNGLTSTVFPSGASDQSQSSIVASSRSSGGSTRSGKAITTRGVNKSFREDLKVAILVQMKSSSSLIPLDLIVEFIQTSLVPSLTAATK